MSDLVDQHQMQEAMGQLKAMREQQAPEAEAEPEERPAPQRPARTERAEPEHDDDGEDLHFKNDDEAYEHLQNLRDERAHDEADDDPAHSSATFWQADDAGGDSDSTSADPEMRWSETDIEVMLLEQGQHPLQQAAQAWQQDAAAFEQIKAQIDLNALEQRDRGKAQMIRQQLNAVEADLRQSHAAIQAEAGKLQGKKQQQATTQMQKRIAGEEAKLAKLAPNLDKQALATYLTGSAGFSQQELADSVGDARLVAVLEKARKWDEQEASKGQRKVPRMRKGAKGRTSASPGRSPDAVSAAMDQLKRDGTMDSALEYLRVSKQQRRAGR